MAGRATARALAADFQFNLKGIFQNRCSRRIYWAGDTEVLEVGAALRFASRVRYEQWACSSLGDARLLRETRNVRWSLSVPRAPLDRVAVSAALEDIIDFPDAVERMFGLRVREQIPIPIPAECGNCDCAAVIDTLRPVFEATPSHTVTAASRPARPVAGSGLPALRSTEKAGPLG